MFKEILQKWWITRSLLSIQVYFLRQESRGKTYRDWRKYDTAQKIKFSIKDFFSKCDQIRSFLQIWSHLLKKSLMEIVIFCAVWGEFILGRSFITIFRRNILGNVGDLQLCAGQTSEVWDSCKSFKINVQWWW